MEQTRLGDYEGVAGDTPVGDTDTGREVTADDLEGILELVQANADCIGRITETLADGHAATTAIDDLPNQDSEIRGFD